MNSRSIVSAYAQEFMRYVFLWMGSALGLSAVAAYGVATIPELRNVFYSNALIPLILLFVQLGLVIYLSAGLSKMRYQTAVMVFIGYALLTGITLSSLFLVYTYASIVKTFFVAAALFLSMGLYGFITKRDLTGVGNVALMLLFGLLIVMLINMFVRSSAIELMFSVIGVVIFSILTAYDMQRLVAFAEQSEYMAIENQESVGKLAIAGALMLYLDFINLFLFLLRLLGNRKQ